MALDFCHLSQQMDGSELFRIFTMDLPDFLSTGFPISRTPTPRYPDTFRNFRSAREELNPVQLLSGRTADRYLCEDPMAHDLLSLSSGHGRNLLAPLSDRMADGISLILYAGFRPFISSLRRFSGFKSFKGFHDFHLSRISCTHPLWQPSNTQMLNTFDSAHSLQ